MLLAGMNVARLNFSHGNYEEHQKRIECLRSVAEELDLPLMLLQDLQGPKIRIGDLPKGKLKLTKGEALTLLPISDYKEQPATVGIDYPFVAEDATVGTQVLLDDGLLELSVERINGKAVECRVIGGGILKSHKGVKLSDVESSLTLHHRERQARPKFWD